MMNGFNGQSGIPGQALRRALAAALLASLAFAAPARAQRVLTLEDALGIAMEKSPRIKHSKLNLERSEASLTAANARLKSKFSLAVTPIEYTNYTRFNDLFSTWYTQESTSSFGTFRIDQPIQWTDGTLSLINTFSWKDSYSEYNDESSETNSNDHYINFHQPLFTYN
ncbi:MAG: TolC family protein, partial [Candidatus Krumholzibacteria bacterium]|nr:TolC family protein [Candidatus Krumholzibacteria bacterium]